MYGTVAKSANRRVCPLGSVVTIVEKISRRVAALGPDAIADVHEKLASRSDVISFAAGAPSADLLPVDLIGPCVSKALDRHGPAALQYGAARGFQPLLAASEPILARRGVPAGPDRTHISTGGSGALNNIAAALVEPGLVVLVERPTYAPAVSVFRSHGARVVGVATDDLGPEPSALDAALGRNPGALVYLLPTFQNPTGRTAPAHRRAALADVLRRRDALAIEDDVYWDLRYRGEVVPALCSYAPDNVAYLTSLSKTLAPALRIGITSIPPPLLDAVLRLKRGIDMQTSSLAQAVAAEALASPEYDAHLAAVVKVYAARMSAMSDALQRHMPHGFRWSSPEGGMFVWIDGPDAFDADALVSAALEAGVAVLPGSAFHADIEAQRNALRLSIAGVAADDVDSGIKILAEQCRAEVDD